MKRRYLSVMVGLLGLLSIGLAGGQRTAAAPVATAPACTATLCFSHAVLTDFQRPGFEPDVKVAPDGTIYSSMPFGFSTTQSFLWSSLDHGNSYQLTPGNLAGKPATCVGGGDTDLLVDPGGELYFSDLQGLTNISQSASADKGATFTTNCTGVPNAPVDRMWFASTGSLAKTTLNLYEDYDAVDSSSSGGNELVETVSHDGTTGGAGPASPFQPVIGTSADCPAPALPNCVTENEGISGNQVVNPTSGNIFISHTDSTSGQVLVSEGKVSAGTAGTTDATWTESPVLDAALCPNNTGPTACTSGGSAQAVAGENFASIAQDSAGYLYVTFTFAPITSGVQSAPEAIYVVHSLQPATMSDPSTLTWSAPLQISNNQATPGTNVFPWITAGSSGRVDVAWYHTDTSSSAGAGSDTTAEWSVQLGQSLNARAASPAYTVSPVSESSVKYGAICTNGLGCATGGDRSLGDFLQVTTDSTGAALVSYVYDTSADTAAGENAGPTVISRQISGSSLNAAHPTVSQGKGPGVAEDKVSDPSGDDYFSSGGTMTPAGPSLDLRGASLEQKTGSIVATITLGGDPTAAISPTVGGPDAAWLLRWTLVTPGQTGNGHIFYAGYDNGAGTGTGTFFDGDTGCLPQNGNPEEHCKYLTYPETHTLSGAGDTITHNATTGLYTITITVPKTDVGNPAKGVRLYSGTAFSATAAYAAGQATAPFNEIDATTPLDETMGDGPGGTGPAAVPVSAPVRPAPSPPVGLVVGLCALLGVALLAGRPRAGRPARVRRAEG